MGTPTMWTVYDAMGTPVLVPQNWTPGSELVNDGPLIAAINGANNAAQGNVTTGTSLNQTANGLMEVANLHNTLLTNGQLISSGDSGNVSSSLPTTVTKRPWLNMPEGGVPFDPATAVALPGVLGSATVVSFTVPDGYDGVVNAYSWNFTGGGFQDGSGDLQAQVLRNGAAVRNYDNILVQKGTIAMPRPISPLRVYSGQVISLVINHLNNNLLSGNVIGSFVGYFYPSAG